MFILGNTLVPIPQYRPYPVTAYYSGTSACGMYTNRTGRTCLPVYKQLAAHRHFGVAGTIMGAAAQFNVTVKGRGGHAAMPHTTVDPVVAGASIVTALQVTSITFVLTKLIVNLVGVQWLLTCVQQHSLNSVCCRNSLHAPVGQSTCNMQSLCTACAQLHVIVCAVTSLLMYTAAYRHAVYAADTGCQDKWATSVMCCVTCTRLSYLLRVCRLWCRERQTHCTPKLSA